MAPVKIRDIVSFTSQDQKNSVENLRATEDRARPWLCSPQDRNGVLKAELQLERATAIGYIDVGNCGSAFIQIDVGRSSWPLERAYITLLPTAILMSPDDSKHGKGRTGVRMFKRADFLPAGADELWDRVRVTCSQPFNKRTQFGLSFLRIRSPEEEGAGGEEERVQGSQGQRTPEQQTSSVREWLSSPAVQRTFFGRRTGDGSPGIDHVGETSEASGWDKAGLSRAARMVMKAAQSGRRSLLPDLPSPASPPSSASPSTIQRSRTAVHHDGAQASCIEGKAATRTSTGIPHIKAGRGVKRKLDSRKRPQAQSTTGRKKPKPAPCEQSLVSSLPCFTAPPVGMEEPETCCPLCGGYFSPLYLPQHASFCQGEEPEVEMSFTPPYSPAHTSGPTHSSTPHVEQDLVPCPLCCFRFPTSQIQLHASSCGDPVGSEWTWLD